MKKEKALKYLRITEFKKQFFNLLVKNYSNMFPEISSSIWTEILIDLNYEEAEKSVANMFVDVFDEEDLDVLIDFAKQPFFKKFIDMTSNTDINKLGVIWYKTNCNLILEKIKNIFPIRGISKETENKLLDIFSGEIWKD